MNKKVRKEKIDELIDNAVFEDVVFHNKVYALSCKLPNGYVITKSISFDIVTEKFDIDLAREICLDKITNELVQLEAYIL